MLIIHGLSDRLIFPEGTINYYQNLKETMGGDSETFSFARLYLIPGFDHNYQNPALNPVNYFESLIQWVEQDIAPESIKVEHHDNTGKVNRTAFYKYSK